MAELTIYASLTDKRALEQEEGKVILQLLHGRAAKCLRVFWGSTECLGFEL